MVKSWLLEVDSLKEPQLHLHVEQMSHSWKRIMRTHDIILHAQEASLEGFKGTNIVCRDTDVLVLLLANHEGLGEEVWMQLGTC